jgi:YtfJ family uncharacterized protein
MLKFFLLLALATSSFANSSNIVLGQKIPFLVIDQGGELYLDNTGRRHYKPWSTVSLKNRKSIIQYMPGRLSSKENLRLNDAVFKIDHPNRCRTISIINYMDAIPGTWIFIEPEMGRNKKITPLCGVVLDKMSLGLTTWGLDLGKNATIVVNEQGIVEFFYSGRLSEKQIEMIVELTNLPGKKAPAKKHP